MNTLTTTKRAVSSGAIAAALRGQTLDFTQTASNFVITSLDVTAVDAGATDFRSAAGYFPDVNLPDTQGNYVWGMGWNWSANGNGQADPTEPAIGIAFERYFVVNGDPGSEVHIQAWTSAGDGHRLFSSWVAHDGSRIDTSVMGDTFLIRDSTGSGTFQFNASLDYLEVSNSGYISFAVNNTKVIEQMNAAGNARLPLPYYDAQNSLQLNAGFNAVGATQTAGSYANIFAMLQPTSLPVNGYVLNSDLPTVAGSVRAFRFGGSAISGTLTAHLANETDNNGNANVQLLLSTGSTSGGKSYITHAWGGTDILVGIDRTGKWMVATNVPGNGASDKFIVDTTTGGIEAKGLVLTPASATGSAGLRLPHGAAPTSPVDGDMWTTTAGLFVRINGSTVGPLS